MSAAPPAPPAVAAGPGASPDPRHLFEGFEPLGLFDVFGQVQRAAGIAEIGLLGRAAIAPAALLAALQADLAGIGTPEQTRLLAHPDHGYVLEDARFGFRVPTGTGPAQGGVEQVYPAACRWLATLAERLRQELRTGQRIFLHAAASDATADSLAELQRAVARHRAATLLAVQPAGDAGAAGEVVQLAPGLLHARLAAQTTLGDWVALCRQAEQRARPAAAEAAPAPALRLGICAIVRNEGTSIAEWIAFHRLQGVSEFRIYDNGSTDRTVDVLRALGVEPIIWAGRPADFDAQQRAAYLESAQVRAGALDWLGFIDADEFVFGRNRPLAEVLADLPPEVAAIAVQQRVFGSNGHRTRTRGLVIERFTRSAPASHPEHLWFKTIARPQHVRDFDSVHSVVLDGGAYVMADGTKLDRTSPHPGEAARHVRGAIGLHHYSLKSLAEFRDKQAKWADRTAASRIGDEYFFRRDSYAGLEECRDLADRAAAVAALLGAQARGFSRDVLVLQTADPVAYAPMLAHTATANQAYCAYMGYRYRAHDGIVRGTQPWQATYNRIFLLQELLAQGFDGWVVVLGPDAFVADWAFDVDQFVATHRDRCLIAAADAAGSAAAWDVNAGVTLLDLGDPDGRALLGAWRAAFDAQVPQAVLDAPQSARGDAPDAQDLLRDVLRRYPMLLQRCWTDTAGLFGDRDGAAIRQASRARLPDMTERLAWIAAEIARARANRRFALTEADALRPVVARRPPAAPRASTGHPLAVVTMVYNEPDFLPFWLKYYGGQIGAQNCFVLDHGSDDGSTNNLAPASVIRIPRSDFSEEKRAPAVSALCASLLQWYDHVAYVDVDEILVADPAIAPSLSAYCQGGRAEVTTAYGLDLFHRLHHHVDLDFRRPVLHQRDVAKLGSNMCKASLIRRPIEWDIGFHSYDGPAVFDGLYLFHLSMVDFAAALRRQAKRRRVVEDHPYLNHPHRQSDSDIRNTLEAWSRRPVAEGPGPVETLAARVIASQGKDNGVFHVDLGIELDANWKIPERFRDAF